MGVINTPSSPVNRSTRETNQQVTEVVNMRDQIDLIDSCRTFHPQLQCMDLAFRTHDRLNTNVKKFNLKAFKITLFVLCPNKAVNKQLRKF